MTTRAGAAQPIVLKVGVAAMISMPAAISAIVRIIAGLRPALSAKAPSTTAPTGRERKPIQNTSSAESRRPVSLPDGKNASPISLAKKE